MLKQTFTIDVTELQPQFKKLWCQSVASNKAIKNHSGQITVVCTEHKVGWLGKIEFTELAGVSK